MQRPDNLLQTRSGAVFLSVFDVFKVGIGPYSSHTMGPMTAAASFLHLLQQTPAGQKTARIGASLHGSLAFNGKSHATDRAVALGLLGWLPAGLRMEIAEAKLADLHATRVLHPQGLPAIAFDPAVDIVFDYGPPLAGHANKFKETSLGGLAVNLPEC